MAVTGTSDKSTGGTATSPPRWGRAPGAWPLLGHAVPLLRRPLEFLDSLAAHGDVVEIRLAHRRAHVLCHPDLAQQVLTDFRTFDRAGPVFDRVRKAMGSGLATAPYADHRRQRLVMQPAFRHEHLRGYVEAMRQEIVTAMSGWRDGRRIDVVDEMFKLTTAVALRTLFSSQISTRDADELREAFDVFLRGSFARSALPMAGVLPTPANRRYDAALAQWRGHVARLVDGYRRAGTERDDLMSRLLAARDEDGEGLTGEELSDQVAVLLLAGGETTSAALAWSLRLLGDHPEVLAAVHAEVDAVLGGEVAGWDHLPRLDLTARVVQESLRLYPPAWVIPRTVVRETRLAGRTLPPGSMVLFSPYVLHRRADLYARPDVFDPDRWIDPASARRGSYLPFGAGATKCVGEEFGTAEATLVLASVTARWSLAGEPGRLPTATRSVLAPTAFPVRLSARGTGAGGAGKDRAGG